MELNRFDAGVERKGTNCAKWDGLKAVYGDADLLPLWVADMDFRSPDCVNEALAKLVAHGAYGYEHSSKASVDAVVNWMQTRHSTRVSPDMVAASPGVVDSLNMMVSAYTQPGDKVIIQPPVYGPFFSAVKNAGRELVYNPLIETENGWQMDLAGLEACFKTGAKLMLLCNPHNPVGRVYARAELRALCELANEYGAIIVSDEIHADFEMPGHEHVCILRETDSAVALVSATKTFNLAALRYSSILFGSEELKRTAEAYMRKIGVGGGNLFGRAAQTAAYTGGGDWLDALIEYVYANYQYARERITAELPRAKVSDMQGTYLMWLDLRAYGMNADELSKFIIEKARLALSGGAFFGAQGEGFMRVNLATPRRNVTAAMDRLIKAFS